MPEGIVDIGSITVGPREDWFEYEHRDVRFCFKLHPQVAKPNTYSFFLLDQVHVPPGGLVLDVGTGSGFLGIVIAGTADVQHVVCTDINPDAIAVARENAMLNAVQDRVDTRLGNLFEPVKKERFDLILSQPRQTPTPPDIAETERRADESFYLNTSGGRDGLEFIAPLVAQARDHLVIGGRLQMVIVDYLNITTIMGLMVSHGLQPETSAVLKTRLSPMTKVRRQYIVKELEHAFHRDEKGEEYMSLVVLTGKAVS